MRNKKPKFYYVYVITNLINNKQYVGSKICYEDDPENDNYFGSSKFLKKDIKDLGKENFEKKIIQQDYKNHQDLLDGESFYILKYNTLAPNGYNRFLPNERKSFNTVGISIKEIWETNYGKEEADKRYEEWKNKINNSGENNPMFGKHHSEKTRKQMSENHADVNGINNPNILGKDAVLKVLNLLNSGMSVKEILKEVDVSQATIYRTKNGFYNNIYYL